MPSAPSTMGLGRHALCLRWLKISLLAGAAYDVIFAAVLVLLPEQAEQLLEVRPPGDAFYLHLIAVFLLMLAAFYTYAAYDPRAYSGNIRVAILGRTAGFAVMVAAALADPTLWGLYVLAFGDLFFALLHALFWWPIRR